MKYEFHVGDYVEMIGGFVGWVRQTREGFIWVANKDVDSCSFRIPEDLDCFKRIGQYDFTKNNKVENHICNNSFSITVLSCFSILIEP